MSRAICAASARAVPGRTSFNPWVQGSTPWRPTQPNPEVFTFQLGLVSRFGLTFWCDCRGCVRSVSARWLIVRRERVPGMLLRCPKAGCCGGGAVCALTLAAQIARITAPLTSGALGLSGRPFHLGSTSRSTLRVCGERLEVTSERKASAALPGLIVFQVVQRYVLAVLIPVSPVDGGGLPAGDDRLLKPTHLGQRKAEFV